MGPLEDHIRSLTPWARNGPFGGYLTFGGFYVEPGHVKYGGTGSFKIGEIDGSRSRRVAELADMLSTQQRLTSPPTFRLSLGENGPGRGSIRHRP